MNQIFNLNNKLISVQHRVTQERFKALKMPQQAFEQGVQAELIKQLAMYVIKVFPIQVTSPTASNDAFEWLSKGYVLTETDMMNVLKEVCEMDDHDRLNLLKSCNTFLGIKS